MTSLLEDHASYVIIMKRVNIQNLGTHYILLWMPDGSTNLRGHLNMKSSLLTKVPCTVICGMVAMGPYV